MNNNFIYINNIPFKLLSFDEYQQYMDIYNSMLDIKRKTKQASFAKTNSFIGAIDHLTDLRLKE